MAYSSLQKNPHRIKPLDRIFELSSTFFLRWPPRSMGEDRYHTPTVCNPPCLELHISSPSSYIKPIAWVASIVCVLASENLTALQPTMTTPSATGADDIASTLQTDHANTEKDNHGNVDNSKDSAPPEFAEVKDLRYDLPYSNSGFWSLLT